MASNEDNAPLIQAFSTLSKALKRLEDAAAYSTSRQKNVARGAESMQAEITASWETHTAELASNIAALTEENAFLKEDNIRLSNQLQALQQEYISLQEAAGQTLNRLDGSIKQLDMLLEH